MNQSNDISALQIWNNINRFGYIFDPLFDEQEEVLSDIDDEKESMLAGVMLADSDDKEEDQLDQPREKETARLNESVPAQLTFKQYI